MLDAVEAIAEVVGAGVLLLAASGVVFEPVPRTLDGAGRVRPEPDQPGRFQATLRVVPYQRGHMDHH